MRTLRLSLVASICWFAPSIFAADFPLPEKLPAQAALPDPLTMLDGTKVTTVEAWEKQRAPELRRLFQHYMYGVLPSAPKNVKFETRRHESNYFNGKATLNETIIWLGVAGAPKLHVLAVTPNRRTKPAPVFVGLNFAGNHTLLHDPEIPLSTVWIPKRYAGTVNDKATEASRGILVDAWSLEQTIDRGYAVVTCYCGDIDPDFPDFTDGVHPQFKSSDDPNAKWGTIAAWAWGLMRLVDYVESNDEHFDQGRIIAFGHSRLGKTALVAAAFDPRIDMAIPNQAGCGGTAPSRGTVGESVARINTSFPHWFCENFKQFNQTTDRLPFDQHCLIALCAPRPVLLANAVEDQWANPDGQFEMLVAASPVYQLFGDKGTAASDKPPVGKLLTNKLGYHIREGKHSTTPDDWRMYCDFADAQFGKP